MAKIQPEKKYSDKIEFWREYWRRSMNSDFFYDDLFNANTLISEIIDEIRYNNLQNEKNKRYFLKKWGFY